MVTSIFYVVRAKKTFSKDRIFDHEAGWYLKKKKYGFSPDLLDAETYVSEESAMKGIRSRSDIAVGHYIEYVVSEYLEIVPIEITMRELA